ncbi:hypothetical protein SISSUDRAFT_892176 [Sistotremastrum suecicum HHB10207 ss-3]|uniref:Eisosome component PIL1-domain-containing protein n=1 Tax=Sistotremastrum suecicum HHB10207 ss-3 TaxID=1314776 RepID=A0A166HCS4_9AGAM|nr:hypothetical protein SISSUDRAFT_892176 [Sistotremastrum suecicum HHB10207 ss-3]
MFKSSGGLSSKIAHTSILPVLGNQDLRSLQDLITAEKSVLSSIQKLATDLTKASESLKIWGAGEGDDLGDVLNHSCAIFAHVSSGLLAYASHEIVVRDHMKAIRTREEKLDETKRRRKAVGSKAEAAEKKLSKMGSENKNLVSQTDLLNKLREEIRMLDTEIMTEEAKLSDFKRLSTKNFMALKLGGLLEFAEKATIVGELGKLIIDEIPIGTLAPGHPRPMYTGRENTEKLEQEISRCVGEVVFAPIAHAPSSDSPFLQQQQPQTPQRSPSVSRFQPPPGPHPAESMPSSPQNYQNRSTFSGHPEAYAPYAGTPTTQHQEFGERMPEPGTPASMHPSMHEPGPNAPSSLGYAGNRGSGPSGGKFATFPVNSRIGDRGPQHNPNVVPSNPPRRMSGASEQNGAPSIPMQTFQPPPGPPPPSAFHYPREEPALPPPGPAPEASLLPYTERAEEPQEERPHHVRIVLPGEEHQEPEAPQAETPVHNVGPNDLPAQDQTQPPSIDEPESARDTAAAQEIGRELDALEQEAPSMDRAASPLLPPAPPYANRAVSPGPPMSLPPAAENSPYFSGNDGLAPRTPTRVPAPSMNNFPLRSASQSSFGPGEGTPYSTPPEYASPGGGKISAAAFKRGPPRSPAADMGETSPLHVRKRPLPTSPYPPARLATNELARAMRPQAEETEGGYERSGQATGSPQSANRTPVSAQDGHVFGEAIGTPSDADTSLGNASVSHEEGQVPRSPGYGSGRFTTNLE